jgi:nucleoside-diphosphate-sugar epimerase
MRIAILGANGRVAHAVAKAFLDHGHAVIAITRSGRCDGLTGKVEFRAADAASAAPLIAATEGADIIFNGLNPRYDEWDEKVMPMARNVMTAARTHGIPHLFIGNVYNYGHGMPVGAGPETPQRAETRKGQIRIDMERMFEQEASQHGVKTVILRAGDFFGTAGKGSWFDQALVKDIEKGIFAWPGRADIPHAFAYLPDLAEAFVALAERMDTLPTFASYNFEGHTLDGNAFRRHVEQAVGRSLRMGSAPWWMFRLVSPFYRMARELLEMRYLWNTPHSLDDSALRDVIGPPPATPAFSAIRDALVAQGKQVRAG